MCRDLIRLQCFAINQSIFVFNITKETTTDTAATQETKTRERSRPFMRDLIHLNHGGPSWGHTIPHSYLPDLTLVRSYAFEIKRSSCNWEIIIGKTTGKCKLKMDPLM